MSGRDPDEIWQEGIEEGARRVDRSTGALLATGFVGGLDVMLGLIALVVLTGGLAAAMPEPTAHVLGSLAFGIGFVIILIGRSELFTENFMIPVATVIAGERGLPSLLRLWGLTLVGNLVAVVAFAWIASRAGVLPKDALKAGGSLADVTAARGFGAALLSAIVAGAVMTLMTWLAHAAQDGTAKVLIALLIGFLLAAPSLNHAVVSLGELAYGVLAGEGSATWTDALQNFPVAVLGNLIGGLGLVTTMRGVQVQGEPAS